MGENRLPRFPILPNALEIGFLRGLIGLRTGDPIARDLQERIELVAAETFYHQPVKRSADASFADGLVTVDMYASADPGPTDAFTKTDSVMLDEAHATALLGTLTVALGELREARG